MIRIGQPPMPLVRAVDFVRHTLTVLHRKLVPGPIALMEVIAAGWLTQALYAAANLGIADALAEGPRTGRQLARAVGAQEDALHRLMRLLISHGIFTRDARGRYALTALARPLCADSEVSLRDAVLFFGSELHRRHWTHITEAVRTGEAVGAKIDGKPFFEYVADDRETGEIFDRAMTSISTLTMGPLLASYDFGRFGTVVDVGGGEGLLLGEILRGAPRSRGILFDLPEVVAKAPATLAELGVADRCVVESGSFFDRVPPGGDAYLLKHIVHDWDEEQIGQILRVLRTAMTRDSRLLLVELVLPENTRPHPGKYIDLEMLINTGGRERTESEYRDLLAQAGFTLERCVPTISPDNILEARLT
ncbi:methyltransferase [Nocardia noduli]|uniref:methyltransferase n=1 Tax=Nocardia noduli TaxID=2815722 RepID=UPI001C224138|nr:methyltransferase [Nocardia noduli]